MSDGNTVTSSIAVGSAVTKSRMSMIRQATQDVLSQLSSVELDDPEFVEYAVITACHTMIDSENAIRNKGDKLKQITELLPAQIAEILVHSKHVVRVAAASVHMDDTQDILALYQEDGDYEGIYLTSELAFAKLIRQYNYGITTRDIGEALSVLKELAPRVEPCREPNLIAVNNGIFDYDTKELLPFSPDYVFLAKSKVNYNLAAQNVVIHNDDDNTDWDVESWVNELSDDAEIVDLLWQIMGAIIRPNVAWNKSAWFYSESGNNGKGTLCELMRQLCGNGSYASVSLSDFSKDFMLEPLIRATSIIVDENDVGTFIDKAANLKAVVTGDVIVINRKFKQPIAYSFKGFMVQCLNEMPRIRDKSDSFFRRQLFVPFTKCFTGVERKYIKNDYLHRKEVLEYVLYKVLNMNYYQLSEPASCHAALEEYKTYADPIRLFLSELMPQFKWDLLPSSFLYDVYREWYKRNNGGEHNLKSNLTFSKEIKRIITAEYPAWAFTDDAPVRTSTRMNEMEPLIAKYELKDWMTPGYTGAQPDKCCHPVLASRYRGFYRKVRQVGSDEDVMYANLASFADGENEDSEDNKDDNA